MGAFRRARADVASLFAFAGIDPTKTRESARDLGLNRGLTWRLTRMVRESDAAQVVTEVPGSQSMEKFFQACRGRGVPESAVSAAADSFAEFDAAVASCSGDRKTLAMMMANHGVRSTNTEAEKARRKLFEGACSVWGVQAQLRFVTVFIYPSPEDPDKLDVGHVTGFVGFRRLSARPWPLSYEAVHKSTGEAAPFVKEPLAPSGDNEEGRAQLMQDYCSPRDLNLQVVQLGDYKRFELATGPVGNEGISTCVFGSRLRKLYDRYSETPETAGFMVLLHTPIERVMFDYFVHKDLQVSTPPRAQLLDRLAFPHANIESDFERQSLPISEAPFALSPGVSGALTPYIPWYPKLLDDVTNRIGQPMEDFEGSRFEMNYPPISTTLSRRFDLSPRPKA